MAASAGASPDTLVRVYGDPGTLYSKCGGVFGVAAFVDRCMDKWMADPVLNANQAVTMWHQRTQRCGFKFLVVQIVCNLTGGPQRYTGRPMDKAHKHLNISETEWGTFMEIFNEVCGEFNVPPGAVDDLNALMISMERECVVYPGERVPPTPPPSRVPGSCLYARIGGVYPIALFADRLVDAMLRDDRVMIPVDPQKRNEASLTYLFTELVCSLCGGPEVSTARDFDETKLLVPKAAWPILISTAEVAADHLPAATRPSLIQVLMKNQDYIVDANSADAPAPAIAMAAQVKDVRAASAGKMLSTEEIAARHAAPAAHVAARKRVFGDPRTLYGRGGGVFGLARLADALMEAWMADPFLNANQAVVKWHQSQQKSGFKFLVTQVMGYLTGGPQRYTGRPMDEAHKHLSISADQWQSFMAGANQVFRGFSLDQNTKSELAGILETYRSSCVLGPGEVAPADPGLVIPQGANGALYYRLGGVYPIAQFVDSLVELVLKGDRVHIQSDQLTDPAGKRHPPGLKYMLTELVCNGTGGPEVVTSRGFDDAKLGVSAEEWPAFIKLATEAAAIWPIALRNSVVGALGAIKAEICVGVVEEAAIEEGRDAQARKVQAAGFDSYLSTAALDHCDGDAETAIELLASGWTPIGMETLSDLRALDPDAPRCPFAPASGGGAPPPGHPPVRTAPPEQSAKDECLAKAIKMLADQGMPVAAIAPLLGMDEDSVAAVIIHAPVGHGRVLGSGLQARLDKLLEEDSDLCCPITLMLFEWPVIASDGFIYEGGAWRGLMRNRMVSPMTRQELLPESLPARQKRSAALEFRRARTEELLTFVEDALQEQPRMATEALQRATEYMEVLNKETVPSLARKAAELWRQLGTPIHDAR